MAERQSDRAGAVNASKNYTDRQRAFFCEGITRRAREEGVHERNRTTWLRDQLEAAGEHVRWQTVQAWFAGTTYPGPARAAIVARVLRMRPEDLILQVDEQADDPDWWRAFLRTPDAATMTNGERQIVRFFPWSAPPDNADCRALLSLIRNNAEKRRSA